MSLRFSFKRPFAPHAFALLLLAACQSCSGRGGGNANYGLIIVNAPVAGEVRRVLVSEGMSVNEGAAIVEIAVRTETQTAPQAARTEDPVARAGRNIQTAQSEIEAARAEVVRYEVEVQRLTPLVASGAATQGELDGARALYERAQQRFQQAQNAAQNAQAGLVAARQQSLNAANTAPAMPSEQIVIAQATSAGTVRAISIKPGDRVTAGQPLATLRADQR